jgi:outer membrane receptor protein involved in Fe transport
MGGVRARRALRWLLLAGVAAPGIAMAQPPVVQSGAVSEVVVTAEKREEPLLKAPLSVTAISGKVLELQHALDLEDWAGYVPGLVLGDAGAPGETFLAVDGIGPIGAASEVGVYVNDTPVGSSSSFEGANGFTMDLMPYDLDRVEVLRGPQGTLYGASTMGGLIKYVLAAPDPTHFSGQIGGDLFGVDHAGDAGGGVRGEANIPLAGDTVALRISGYDEHTPGYIDNATTGQPDDNALTQYGGHAALLWQATSDFSAQVSALYQHSHADNQSLVALSTTSGQPIAGGLSNINTRPEPYTQELQLYDLTLNWNLHWAQLTSVSSYQRFDNHTVEDLTPYLGGLLALYGAPANNQSDFNELYGLKKFTQELRLASPEGQPLEWLVGGYYTREDATNYEVFNGYDNGGAFPNPLEFANLPSMYREYAFFGDLTYHFTDWFDLSGGLRYAHNNQTFTEFEGGSLLGSSPPTAAALTVPGSSGEGVTTFSVAPELHLTRDVMAYARIASGYQPGGPNVILPGVTGLPTQFNSSTLTDYQVGVKSSLLDGRASFDLSVFDIEWTRIQVGVLVGDESAIENAGRARSEGVDFSGAYSPIRGLTLGANLSYTDAVLTEAVPSIGAVSGARLPYVPLWSGSLTADYSAPIAGPWRGFIGGGYRYIGSRYSDVQGSTANGEPQGLEVGADNVVDLHLGARTHDLTLTLFAKNLFDERAYLAPANYFFSLLGSPIDIKAPVLQPLTIGVSIDKSF